LYPLLYTMDTFPSPSHSTNNSNEFQSSWKGRRSVLPKHQNKTLYHKQRTNSTWFWPSLCVRLIPGSNLNTETGYPNFGVSVRVYWISRKIPGFTLVRPRSHPDRCLPKSYISK